MSSTLAKEQNSSALIVLAIVPFALVGFLFWDALYQTALICWDDDDYSHGLLLPLISIYLLWERRADLKTAWNKLPGKPLSLIGLTLLIAGVLLWFMGELTKILFVSWVAFFISLSGVAFLVFGYELATFVLPFLLLNFMAKPMPDSLVPALFWPLQVFAADVSAAVLELLSVPVYLRGNVLEIPGMSLMVEEACSGLRSLMALVTVALIVLLSVELRTITKFILVLIAIATAVFLNIVRVAATGVLAHFVSPKTATGFFHSFSGLVVFVIGLVVLFYCGKLLQKIEAKFTRSR